MRSEKEESNKRDDILNSIMNASCEGMFTTYNIMSMTFPTGKQRA